jgi:Transcription factor WhiB
MTAPAEAPPAAQVEPWPGANLDAGAWRSARGWMAQAACAQPGVEPGWFVVDEDAPGAPALVARAKAVCRRCPVRRWCRWQPIAEGA